MFLCVRRGGVVSRGQACSVCTFFISPYTSSINLCLGGYPLSTSSFFFFNFYLYLSELSWAHILTQNPTPLTLTSSIIQGQPCSAFKLPKHCKNNCTLFFLGGQVLWEKKSSERSQIPIQ